MMKFSVVGTGSMEAKWLGPIKNFICGKLHNTFFRLDTQSFTMEFFLSKSFSNLSQNSNEHLQYEDTSLG